MEEKKGSNIQFTPAENRAIDMLKDKMAKSLMAKPSKASILRTGLLMVWELYFPGMAYPTEDWRVVPVSEIPKA